MPTRCATYLFSLFSFQQSLAFLTGATGSLTGHGMPLGLRLAGCSFLLLLVAALTIPHSLSPVCNSTFPDSNAFEYLNLQKKSFCGHLGKRKSAPLQTCAQSEEKEALPKKKNAVKEFPQRRRCLLWIQYKQKNSICQEKFLKIQNFWKKSEKPIPIFVYCR